MQSPTEAHSPFPPVKGRLHTTPLPYAGGHGLPSRQPTCTMESHSRMLARNLLPRPCPSLAPLTRPAMSTNSTLVGTVFLDLLRVLRVCSDMNVCACISVPD